MYLLSQFFVTGRGEPADSDDAVLYPTQWREEGVQPAEPQDTPQDGGQNINATVSTILDLRCIVIIETFHISTLFPFLSVPAYLY